MDVSLLGRCPQALCVYQDITWQGRGEGAAPHRAEDADPGGSILWKHIPAAGAQTRTHLLSWDQSCSRSPPALAPGQGLTSFKFKFCNQPRLCGAGTPPKTLVGSLRAGGEWFDLAERSWIPAVASKTPPGSRSLWIPGAGCAWHSSLHPPELQSLTDVTQFCSFTPTHTK